MNPSIGRVLVIIGIVLVVAAVIAHFALTVEIFPHFNVVLGVIGVIVAAAGVYGMVSKSRNA
jgi:hypothetical protein